MTGSAAGPAALFHLGFEHVAMPVHQLITHVALVLAQH